MANVKHIGIDDTTYDVVPSDNYVTGVKGDNETDYRSGNVNITKANVSLGNVPNVTTNNQTPTFTQASLRANIASGEKLSVLFGKIMKFFADLKTVAFTGAYSDLTGQPNVVIQVKVGSTAYDPSSGVVSLPAYPTDTNNRRVFYGTCSTAAATAAKVITLSDATGWELKAGTTVFVRFTNTNTASNVTLNVNNSGAKSIYYNNSVYTGAANKVCGYASRTFEYTYDGAHWVWVTHGLDDNTTYSSKAAASGGTDVSLVTTGEKYTWNQKGTGTVTQVKVGTTAYNPSSGVVSLPAYPVVDTTFNAQSNNAIANKPVTNVINNIKNFSAIATNNSKVPIFKNGNGWYYIRCMDNAITISSTGVSTIDKISSSSNYPPVNIRFSGTLSNQAGTIVYPCIVLINTDGNIQIRQKDVTSNTLYLNADGLFI